MKNFFDLTKAKKAFTLLSKSGSKRSEGFSLIELLVAVALSTILLAVIVGLTIQVYVNTNISNEAFKAQDDALVTMNYLTKEIRQATQVIAAGSQSITIREYVKSTDTVPSQVRFYLQGGSLIRGQIPPSGVAPNYTYDSASETFKTLSNRVTNGGNTIYTYFDQDGNQLTGSIQIASVTLVGIDLSFDQYKQNKDFNVNTKVQLRFRKYNL